MNLGLFQVFVKKMKMELGTLSNINSQELNI